MPIHVWRGFFPEMRFRWMLLVAGFLVAMVAGFWIARSAVPEKEAGKIARVAETFKAPHETPDPEPWFKRGERAAVFKTDNEAQEAGALVGQRGLVFKDRASLEAFLKRAGNKVIIMGRLEALNILRVGFLNYQDLADLLDGSEQLAMIFPANVPENEYVAAQPGAVAMGNSLLNWLGITGDNSSWGAGVTIAVLDTGVSPHSAFGGKISVLGAAGDVNGHGTAVASMILGNTDLLPGVAPGSSILSIQVADAAGYSDSFKIAEGILAAVDAGVDIINISMGSSGDSAVLRAAIQKAIEAGVMIVAPTGNSGLNQVFYPAANEGVVAIGAVDRNGAAMAFSNYGDAVAVAAPGYGLNSAWVDDGAVSVSGTSFSSPIIAGLIAATMTESGGALTANQAWQQILNNLNEAGAPGVDPYVGGGLPDMSRVLASGTKGIYDAAVASQWVSTVEGNTQLQVTVQNRGTETLVNTNLQVNSPAGTNYFNATTLTPGAIQTFTVPLSNPSESMRFESSVSISNGQSDSKPANNRRVETYTTTPAR